MYNIKLTRREKEILNLLLEGTIPKEIAFKLKIGYNTVISHQRKLYRKFNVHSIEELLEKHQAIAAEGGGKIISSRSTTEGSHDKKALDITPLITNNWQKHLKPKYFIPLGLGLVLLFILFFIILKPAKDPSFVYLEDGTYFTLHNFDNVHLLANRWVLKENDWYGENYHSIDRIRLKDFYNGTIDNLIPNPSINNEYKFRLSGNIDKESKFTKIEINYISHGEDRSFFYLGGTDDDNIVNIGPGEFSEVFILRHSGIDINTLPEPGVCYFAISNELFYNSFNDCNDNGERIPGNIPNQTIWATINNLKIEPVDVISKKK